MPQNVLDTLPPDSGITLIHSPSLPHSAQPGLPLLRVSNPHCDALIALQGAQLLSFTPKGSDDLLWLSPNAVFAPGQAIRGGIPVCLPWFGVNREDPSKQKHGFVRNRDWQLLGANSDHEGRTHLTLGYDYAGDEPELFPHPFRATLTAVLGATLTLTLSVQNRDSCPMPLSWAWHSYFPVDNLDTVCVSGLDGIDYLDNTQGLSRQHQHGPVQFKGEVDRVYESVPALQQIQGQPAISLHGSGCDTAIVWNPGAANSAQMGDLGTEIYRRFICVERGMAFANAQCVAPGDEIGATLEISATT